MRNHMAKKTILAVLLCGCALLWASSALAVVGACVNCHTMHDSQNGANVGAAGQFGVLLNDTCIGCHTGTNSGGAGDAPFVNSSVLPTYGPSNSGGNTLAGGNFYWVAQAGGDAKGHNVLDIVAIDGTLTSPPGFGTGEAAPDTSTPAGGTWNAADRLTCSGTLGCHGTHSLADQYQSLQGSHHTNSAGHLEPADGDTPGTGFRFLQGTWGNEDVDWEYTAADNGTDHNQYYGVDQAFDNNGINALCARCHGAFHGDSSLNSETVNAAGAWIRHPTDYDLGNTTAGSEYRSYNGGPQAAAPYSIVAPVGSTNDTSALATIDISANNGQGIVMCLSCHRAHGSPYDDLLRWDYSTIVAGGGGGNIGCFICHTTKD